MPKYIDTHAHLDSDVYARELEHVIKRALDADVWIVTLGSDLESSRRAVEIASRYPSGVYAAVGLHPLKVTADSLAEDKLVDLDAFRVLAENPKVVALGECGLDYHDLPPPVRGRMSPEAEAVRINQKKVFRQFLQLSEELRLPLLLHCREAYDDAISMIETWDKTSRGFDCRGIVHCFTGDWKQARRFFNRDFYISVVGAVAHGAFQTELIRKAPLNRLVLESDCPHLTSPPWAMRRNEPSFLPLIAAGVAAIRGEKPEQVAVQTAENALKILNRLRMQ